jgi:phage baseplate assembly protein W
MANLPDFGTDLNFIEDIPLNDQLCSGLRNLGNAMARRLITERGSLKYAPDYGTDVREFLNDGMTPPAIAALVAAVQQELESDERILRANVTATDQNLATSSLTMTIQIDTEQGTFPLVLSVSDVTVELLKVG